MEHMVHALRGWTVPYVVAINRAADVFERDGSLKSAAAERQLGKLGAEVARAARLFGPGRG